MVIESKNKLPKGREKVQLIKMGYTSAVIAEKLLELAKILKIDLRGKNLDKFHGWDNLWEEIKEKLYRIVEITQKLLKENKDLKERISSLERENKRLREALAKLHEENKKLNSKR